MLKYPYLKSNNPEWYAYLHFILKCITKLSFQSPILFPRLKFILHSKYIKQKWNNPRTSITYLDPKKTIILEINIVYLFVKRPWHSNRHSSGPKGSVSNTFEKCEIFPWPSCISKDIGQVRNLVTIILWFLLRSSWHYRLSSSF